MSKERELLKGAVEWMHELKYVWVEERDWGDRALLDLIADINKIEQLLNNPEQNNTQYLLDQVARLTVENAMLKEKWLTKEDEEDEDMLEESGYNRSDWWG